MKQKGFTLVETLVAVSILVIGALGPITIAAQGIASAAYAKDQITAFYLAQEGIEYVRNVRDTNIIQGNVDPTSWLNLPNGDSLETLCSGQSPYKGCQIDAKTMVDIEQCNQTDGCDFMKTDGEGYFGIGTSSDTPTTYKRTITLLPGLNEDEKKIHVVITWTSRGALRNFELNETIYNSY